MTGIHELRNLGGLFGPVRDQGDRPTCLPLAASDLHAGLREAWTPLSCEFLFYHAQRRASRPPTVGATLTSTLDALRHEGQPREERWRYLSATPMDVAAWSPPQDVGEVYRRTGDAHAASIDGIVAALDRCQPLLMLLYLSTSFYSVGQNGLVDPPAAEQPDFARRHAVVAIGHGTHRDQRAILIRNNWGGRWGHGGQAWLAESFLEPRMFGLAILREKTDGALLASTA